MEINYKILTVLFALLFFAACSSPMDINTPRTQVPLDNSRIKPVLTSISVEDNGVQRYFNLNEANTQIDTTLQSPIIWMKLSLSSESTENSLPDRISIVGFDINIDSLIMDSDPCSINGEPQRTPSWMRFKIRRCSNTEKDTTVYADSVFNFANISFSLNKDKKEAWAFVYSRIYNQKYWYEKRDTIITDKNGNKIVIPLEIEHKEKDSLIFHGNFKFQYR